MGDPRCRVAGRIAQSIPLETTRLDGGRLIDIEVNNRLQCLAGSTVAQPFRKGAEPSGVLGLQGEQFGDGMALIRPERRFSRRR